MILSPFIRLFASLLFLLFLAHLALLKIIFLENVVVEE